MSRQRTASKRGSGGKRQPAAKQAGKPAGKQAAAGQAAGKDAPAQRKQARRATRTKPGRGHIGWAGMRRGRREKLGIALVAAAAVALIWVFVEWQLAIGLTALVLLVLPAVVVLAKGRRY